MLSWSSPYVPYYIDIDALAILVYQDFYNKSPHKSGTMRDGIDYQILGRSIYFWNEVVYANYQDQGCYAGAVYEGWWSEQLPKTFDYWLGIEEELSKGHKVFDNI